ncbi:MAG: hypothetical protein OEW93_01355 [Candidatus Bathyarchaeota archaeon]|nr:hypothetical protein [Candidatus Bathyarchaeota archaeon]MDH5790620.1 hypothetical protein [Candidatus Bathyarchaeota archaeon]
MPGTPVNDRVNRQTSAKIATERNRFSTGDFANPIGVWLLALPDLTEERAITLASRSTVFRFKFAPS